MKIGSAFRESEPEPVSQSAPAVSSEPSVAKEKFALLARDVTDVAGLDTDKPLASQDEANKLSEFLARGKVASKELERLRHSLVDPLNVKLKAINGKFKPLADRFESWEVRAKRLLLAWAQFQTAEIERQKREQLRLQEEAAQREEEAQARAEAAETPEQRQEALAAASEASRQQMQAVVDTPVEPVKGFRTDTGTTSMRERWTFNVVDQALIPRSFLMVDEKALRNAVNCGTREIPGVAIYLEPSMAVRVG